MKNTSWEKISSTYIKSVGSEGSYYHKNVVIPNTLRLLNLKQGDVVIDLACGQGVLERHLDKNIEYTGLEISQSLLDYAEKNKKSETHTFIKADVTNQLNINKEFTHSTLILALQNIKDINTAFKNINKFLIKGGKLVIVINHPFIRIPKYSSWEMDFKAEVQKRVITKYLTSEEIVLLANPSKGEKSEKIYSYHRSLQDISKALSSNGFSITKIEEWVSDKLSVGLHAEMENTARREFPMFMALACTKE